MLLAGCQPAALQERPVLDRLDPEVEALAVCVVEWTRDCALRHMRNVLAIMKAAEGA